MRFNCVFVDVRPHYFARKFVGYRERHFLCAAKKSRVNRRDSVDGAERVRNRNVTFRRRDCVVLAFVDVVQIRSQRNKVVIVIRTIRSRREIIGFEFVFVVDGFVVRFRLDLVISLVEHRRFRPVTVESKERNVKIYVVFFFCRKFDKAFNVHTVLEVLVNHRFFVGGQGINKFDLRSAASGYGNDFSVRRAAGNGHFKVVVQNIRSFRNVFFVGRRNAFGHADKRQVVRHRFARNIDDVERHFVFAFSRRIVFKLDFRSVFSVNRKVRLRSDDVFHACKSRTLFPRRIRISLLIKDDRRRRHKHRVCERGYFFHRFVGIFFFQILSDKNHYAAKVGRCHRRSAEFVVAAAGHRGFDIATVRRDFGFDFQRRSGSPA